MPFQTKLSHAVMLVYEVSEWLMVKLSIAVLSHPFVLVKPQDCEGTFVS